MIKEADIQPIDPVEVLSKLVKPEHLEKLLEIRNERLLRWLAEVALTLEPSSIYIITGEPEDFDCVRRKALENREEIPTKYPLKTVHFDGPKDLARDRGNTRILVEGGAQIPLINTLDREKGLAEVGELFRGIMKGKEMYVAFFCYGPKGSPYTLLGVQVTDSAYVAHSELLLYRVCYDEFVRLGENAEYMRFLHSAGERDENGWSRNTDKRRIYIDLEDNIVYSVNTQYAGNTVGLKKLALRLCVYKGYREGWLCEHMFIVGVKGPNDRVTYFTGAFPAGCGKTSTALIADTVVGDDLAIIRNADGVPRAINPEIGMFGIIDGVNPVDDPEIYRILLDPGTEVIFSNILLTEDGEPWWNGRPEEPKKGLSWAGPWWPGRRDEYGKEIPPSHPNARFTTSIRYLEKLDPRIDDPSGVPVGGMIFGGRDSDTWIPVEEAFNWIHGVITKGAALESERTTAVLGRAGEREFNPFAILDFLSISVGSFVELHMRFAEGLKHTPKIFGVNYFLRDEKGNYLTEKRDKRVWLKWMELRIHNDVDAAEGPTGLIPLHQDLAKLFERELGKEYPEKLYEKQFTVRVNQHIAKIERVWRIYEQIPDTPRILFEVLREEKERLKRFRDLYGEYIPPFKLYKR